MIKQELKIGDVVQIDPEHDDVFGGSFMTVSEPKEWGAQGYVHPLEKGKVAYYRCSFEHMELIGKSVWGIKASE